MVSVLYMLVQSIKSVDFFWLHLRLVLLHMVFTIMVEGRETPFFNGHQC